MKILVLGAGKMGSFFIDLLSFEHEVAVFEKDPKRMRFTYNCQRFTQLEEIRDFQPELLINAVTVKYTIPAFQQVIPYIPKDCIISDISSVKTGLKEFPISTNFRRKMPSLSTRVISLEGSFSRIFIRNWDFTSMNIRLTSTIRR